MGLDPIEVWQGLIASSWYALQALEPALKSISIDSPYWPSFQTEFDNTVWIFSFHLYFITGRLKSTGSEKGNSVGSQTVACLAQVRDGKPDGLPKGRVFGTVAY